MNKELNDEIEVLLKTLREPVILAGAGISIDSPSNLPSGRSLMANIIRHAVLEEYVDYTLGYIEPPPISSANPGGFIRFEHLMHVVRQFDKELSVLNFIKDCQSPNMNHYLLANLIKKNHTVITTNFDNLIETAYNEIKEESDPELEVVAYNQEFDKYSQLQSSKKVLWKIHGSFYRNGKNISDSIQAEYTRVLTNNDSPKTSFLSNIIRNNDLLVVGYSGSDDLDIIPILAETDSENKIFWIQHGNANRNKSSECMENLKLVKSKYHVLGLNKILFHKSEDVTVLEAQTTEILSRIDNQKTERYKYLAQRKEQYEIRENYFAEWAKDIKLTDYAKSQITTGINEGRDLSFVIKKKTTKSPVQDNDSEADNAILDDLKKDLIRIDEIIDEFNDRARNSSNLWDQLKELEEIKNKYGDKMIPSLYNIKACIEFEIGEDIESGKNFRTLLTYYQKNNDDIGEFFTLDSMDNRHLLSKDEKVRMNEIVRNIGYYPMIWKRKYERYDSQLSPVGSYKMLASEIGHFLNYNQVVTDLIEMKYYSIAMGDIKGERNIDRLLWKLDFEDDGITKDFDYD